LADIVHLGPRRVDLVAKVIDAPAGQLRLGDRETEVLAYLLQRRGSPVSRVQLLVEVFGKPATASSRAVDKVVSRLRRKLEDNPDAPRFLKTIYGAGYLLDLGEPAPPPVAGPTPAPRARLPVVDAPLVGRAEEMERLLRWAAGDAPGLLTIVGPGGAGKTRLALEVAHTVARGANRDVSWVDLRGVDTVDVVLSRLATALGLAGDADITAQKVRNALASWRTLLVVDNLELPRSTLAGLQAVSEGLAQSALLVTSRLSLGWSSEARLLLGSLSRDEATALVSNLAASRDDAAIDVDALATLVLDSGGLPLAAEWLVAASARGDAVEGSMQDLIEDIWARLQPTEQAALGALALFRTAFTPDGADAVLGAHAAVLDDLVVRGLVRWRGDALAMHPLVVEQAAASASRQARGAYALWLCRHLRNALRAPARSLEEQVRRLEPWMADLHHAWRHPAGHEDPLTALLWRLYRAQIALPDLVSMVAHALGDPMRATVSLHALDVCLPRSSEDDGRDRARAWLAAHPDHARAADVQVALAHLQVARGEHAAAFALLTPLVEHEDVRAEAHEVLSKASHRAVDLGRSLAYAEQAAALARDAGMLAIEARAHFRLVRVALNRQDDRTTEDMFRHAERGLALMGDVSTPTVGQLCRSLAIAHLRRNEPGPALEQVSRAERIFRIIEMPEQLVISIDLGARTLRDRGELTRAERHIREARDLAERHGLLEALMNVLITQGSLARKRARHSDALDHYLEAEERLRAIPTSIQRFYVAHNIAMSSFASHRHWDGLVRLRRLARLDDITAEPSKHGDILASVALLEAMVDQEPTWSELGVLRDCAPDTWTDYALCWAVRALHTRGHDEVAGYVAGYLSSRTLWHDQRAHLDAVADVDPEARREGAAATLAAVVTRVTALG
jgi:tetratricopeptide (TPR) repeat protein